MLRMIKDRIVTDGFLGSLHALLLMDDTVILATSREMCSRKLDTVLNYCREYGMEINEKKTKFFVINGDAVDRASLKISGISVDYAPRYLYLGAWFTDTAKIDDVLALHEISNQATVNKFSIFCAANTLMPFVYKKIVFDAAVTSTLLYSSESWLTNNYKRIEKQYNQLVKCLLNVRKNTSINLCMVEAGIPPLKHVIEKKRCKFLKAKFEEIDLEQPFHFVYRFCRDNSTPGFRFCERAVQYNIYRDPMSQIVEVVRENSETRTKLATYVNELNSALCVHQIYKTKVYIPDYERTAFTRLRLISHNLKIETGRWSRIPRESRVCQCNNVHVQTEKHVLLYCALTEQYRIQYDMLDYSNVSSLLNENVYMRELCKYVYNVLKIFDIRP